VPDGFAPAHVLLVHGAVPRLGPRPAPWSARVFRLAHPLATEADRAALYAWIVNGDVPGDEHASLALLRAHAAAKASEDADAATCVELITASGLPREALPST
jgi:hypothetical protein